MCPAWYFFPRDIEGVREIRRAVGHIFGANVSNIRLVCLIHVVRMCPAWYYLTGMMVLAGAQPLLEKFEAREKIARRSPFDRNVKKVLGFLRIRKSARDEILTFFF